MTNPRSLPPTKTPADDAAPKLRVRLPRAATTVSRIVRARVAFVLLCLLPTLGMVIFAAVAQARRTSQERLQQWVETIRFELGMDIEVERVEVIPAGVVLHDVSVRHPEDNRLVAQARQVHVLRVSATGWNVDCRYPELDADRFHHVWGLLSDRLNNRRGSVHWSGIFKATNLAWRDGDEVATVPHLRCVVRHGEELSRCDVEYALEEQDWETPSKITIIRDRSQSSEFVYDFQTHAGPLPLRWLWAVAPRLRCLGDQAEFDGHARVHVAADGQSHGECRGRIDHIDLSEWLAQLSPQHILGGKGRLDLDELNWEGSRIGRYQGQLVAPYGTVSRSLFEAASQVQLRTPVRFADQPNFTYRDLHLAFNGLRDKVSLHGSPERHGAVLVGTDAARTPLLIAAGTPTDTAALCRWLVPHSEHTLPATPEVGRLAALLHLPAIDVGNADSVSAPKVRLGADAHPADGNSGSADNPDGSVLLAPSTASE